VDFTHLRYFNEIARHGSMTAAARELHVSQPTLTVAIQKLEARLDTTLFHRDRRGMRLTSTGRELLAHAREIFSLVEQAEERVRGLEEEDVGQFVIGCPEVLGAYFLPRFMATFLQRYPRIELTLWNGPSTAVQQAVIAREIQYGLVVNPLPHPDMVLVPLFEDATDLFVSSDEGAAAGEAGARERIRRGPLIFVEGLPQSRQLLLALAEAELLPERQIACGDLELVKSLALGGVGVGVIPRRVAAYGQTDRLTRLHTSLPFVPDTIHLVYRGDLHRTRAARRLREGLVEHGRAME